MKIEAHHFHPNYIFEVEKNLENVLKLDKELRTIIEAELESGNLIAHVTIDWPENDSIVVTFINKISSDHQISKNIKYTFLNDPHYWIHEYATVNKPTHMIIGSDN